MDAANWSASLSLIIAFGLGALGFWFAIRIEADKTIAELRSELREVKGKLDAMSVRPSEFEIAQAEIRGAMSILNRQTRAHKPKSAPTNDA